MKSSTWLRIAAGLLLFFAVGHTFGTFSPPRPDDPTIAAMHNYTFEIMGSHRTKWDFFFGLNLFLSANLLILVVLTWQLSNLARRGVAVRPLIATLFAAAAIFAILGWTYFFIAPALTSTIAAVVLLIAYATPSATSP